MGLRDESRRLLTHFIKDPRICFGTDFVHGRKGAHNKRQAAVQSARPPLRIVSLLLKARTRTTPVVMNTLGMQGQGPRCIAAMHRPTAYTRPSSYHCFSSLPSGDRGPHIRVRLCSALAWHQRWHRVSRTEKTS